MELSEEESITSPAVPLDHPLNNTILLVVCPVSFSFSLPRFLLNCLVIWARVQIVDLCIPHLLRKLKKLKTECFVLFYGGRVKRKEEEGFLEECYLGELREVMRIV